MKNTHCSIYATGLLIASFAQANIDIDTVYVGDAFNSNDTTGYGAVDYGYRIGTYAVTNSQYAAFLNAKAGADSFQLYDSVMDISQSGSNGSYTYSVNAGFENKPVHSVSFWDAARFSNWLTNGQGSGDTESGVYNLGGVANPTNDTITRDMTAWANGGVAIASQNEWYKAAYYSGSPTGADGDGYWLYPTQSNSITTAEANFNNTTLTDVGTYSDFASHYGTFDQAGNLFEWNDTIVGTTERVLRGGSVFFPASFQASSFRIGSEPDGTSDTFGFRVSSLQPIPEPSIYAAIVGFLALTMTIARRKRRGAL
jgi:formylglycine-generating enzyme required for sulfatase activity